MHHALCGEAIPGPVQGTKAGQPVFHGGIVHPIYGRVGREAARPVLRPRGGSSPHPKRGRGIHGSTVEKRTVCDTISM